jgi:hypothetical protein
MGSEQISKYNERIRTLQGKLSNETDLNKKKRINYDIEILKLRVRIESIKGQKEGF